MEARARCLARAGRGVPAGAAPRFGPQAFRAEDGWASRRLALLRPRGPLAGMSLTGAVS